MVRAWSITRVDVSQSEELRTKSTILGSRAAAGTVTTNEVESTSLTEGTLACSWTAQPGPKHGRLAETILNLASVQNFAEVWGNLSC